MSEVAPEAVSWLWHPYIPLGKLTLLEGDPSAGKTCRVYVLTGIETENGKGGTTERAVSLADIPELEVALSTIKPKILILDPLLAYLGAKVDAHRMNETRPLLSALGRLAENHACAVVGIRHFNKSMGGKALYSGLGSIDFIAAARSALHVGERDGERFLTHAKSSLAPEGVALRYGINDGALEWLGVADDVTADDLRQLPTSKRDDAETPLESAKSFLETFLAEGPQPATAVFRTAKQEGISEKTLKRAKALLEVKSDRISEGNEGGGQWAWSLRVHADPLAPLQGKPVTDAYTARRPEDNVNPLQESREGHKKPQGGKRVTSVPIGDNAEREIIAELRRRWQAGDFRGEKLRVPGGITPDLDRTLATYFERKRLSEVERSDLARIAAQVGISPLLFGVVN